MITVDEAKQLWPGLGPQSAKDLGEIITAAEAAVGQVTALETLRTKRQAEAITAAPQVSAGADPLFIAQSQTMSAALATVIGAIDDDLFTARASERRALKAYNDAVYGLGERQQRIGALTEQIDRLLAERNSLQGALAA